MHKDDWQKWYGKFKEHIESSHREILKEVDGIRIYFRNANSIAFFARGSIFL